MSMLNAPDSSYESRLLSEQETHVMLFSFAKGGQLAGAKAALATLNDKKTEKSLSKKGLTNLSSYSTALRGWFILTMKAKAISKRSNGSNPLSRSPH